MEKTPCSEDTFLDRLRAERTPVTLFTTNGVRMRGTIAAYDAATVLMKCDGQEQMLYKHAVSTLIPGRPAAPGTGFLPHSRN